AASVALAVIDVIEGEGLLAKAGEIGAYLPAAVASAVPDGAIVAARGRGCLWGFELVAGIDSGDVAVRMIGEGVLCSTAGPGVIRMSPPLIASTAECDRAAAALGTALAACMAVAQEVPA
ncbi:MAG: acetylornithine/N-succinyldiaminopimelate aminotransferase, partial [Actinomycetota bacterium]|nr:acetylornithine/N-succinyldiaminopimelate aminotransferase [Actinomycetota bacterium]